MPNLLFYSASAISRSGNKATASFGHVFDIL